MIEAEAGPVCFRTPDDVGFRQAGGIPPVTHMVLGYGNPLRRTIGVGDQNHSIAGRLAGMECGSVKQMEISSPAFAFHRRGFREIGPFTATEHQAGFPIVPERIDNVKRDSAEQFSADGQEA